MNHTTDQALVRGYLDRLERAAASLPTDRREELRSSISEHLDAAQAAEAGDPSVVRRTLDQLGPPEEVAAAAGAAPSAPRSTTRELAAVLLLTAGSLVAPFAGWLAGVVLLWTSQLWNIKEKVLGTLVWPGGYASVLLLLTWVGATETCTSSGETAPDGTATMTEVCTTEGFLLPAYLGPPVAAGLLVLPVVVAVLLYRRATRRA